jgi:hypothetical protein
MLVQRAEPQITMLKFAKKQAQIIGRFQRPSRGAANLSDYLSRQ